MDQPAHLDNDLVASSRLARPESHHQCLRCVSPDVLVTAALDLLEETSKTSRGSPEYGDETTCLFEDNLQAPAQNFKQ